MADSKPAALDNAAATGFFAASKRTRFLPAPRDAAA
jgi:hypothetical protein